MAEDVADEVGIGDVGDSQVILKYPLTVEICYLIQIILLMSQARKVSGVVGNQLAKDI